MGIKIWKQVQVRLPAEYQEVEYVQSTGTQYIDTWFTPSVDTSISTSISLWSNSWWAVFFGVTGNDSSSDWVLGRIYADTAWSFNPRFCNSQYDETIAYISTDVFYDVVLASNTLSVDGNSYTITTNWTPYQSSMDLFAWNNGGSHWWRAWKCKIKTFQITDNNVLVRDFVPCYRIADTEIWMYDLVNDVFYTNAGSWTFNKWADIGIDVDISKIYVYVYETVHVTGVTLNKGSIALTTAGQTEQLTATITPSNADDQTVVWSTSDSTVATVSQTWLVTCTTPWTATITVTTNDGGYTASCGVTDRQWQPWANTICYYPLDSTNTLNDLSWHNYTLTNSWSVAFWTNQGVDCAWFTSWGGSSWSRWLYRTSDLIIPNGSDYTFNVWLYKWSETMYYNPRIIGRYGYPIFTYAARSKISVADSTSYWVTPDNWAWFLFTCVYDHTDNTWAFYKNAAYQNTQTNSSLFNTDYPWIVLWTRDSLWTQYWDKWSWWMSNIIIENKKRTVQEISAYYDLIKSDYWIS